MTRVLANGCFDVLHVGHIWHLEAARAMGDSLTVALTLDEFVRKGPNRPINSWAHRARILMALRCVDAVFPSENAPQAIREFKPDVFVKGLDYKGSALLDQDVVACKEVGARLWLTDTPKLGSGDIIERIRRLG